MPGPDDVSLEAPKRVHVVAAGGAAMSGIARYLHALGHTVTGSDVRDSKTRRALATEGIPVLVGHDASNLPERCDLVVVSTAVRDDNPEVVAARAAGVPVWGRGRAMRAIAETRPRRLVVTGTHGKTTTTSMVATLLDDAGWDPAFFIGGTPAGLGTNARVASGDWLVIEGDESDHSFLDYPREAAIVTNVEADHLDRWGDFATLVAGFTEFVDGARGPVVVCADDPVLLGLAEARPALVTYGRSTAARYRATSYEARGGQAHIGVAIDGQPVEPLELAVLGRDMAQNALGAAALAHELGVPWPAVVAGLRAFGGVARRFQYRASYDGVDCYDDYAHTATEVASTLARAREGGWSRVVAVFQPHRYTRIQRHGAEFADAFVDADVVVVTALDPAFEDPIAGIDSQVVVDAVVGAHPDTELVHVPIWDDLARVPWSVARAGDVVVTLGCGTITDAHELWADEAARRAAP